MINPSHVDLALVMAYKSTSKFRLGAVLTRRARVLSTGYNNMSKTHPIMRKYNWNKRVEKCLHAEVDACVGMYEEQLNGTTMYVARILKNGKPAMAKPCKICQTFLTAMGVKRVHYTTANGVQTMELS